jgi:ubiquinone/menaquinone biosynthesis C-methylase UbiE
MTEREEARMMEREGKIAKAYKSSKNYYDDALAGERWWAKLYVRGIWGADEREITGRLFGYLPGGFHGKLLDVPVGTALFTAGKYREMPNARITALDYSQTMLEQARARLDGCPNVTCVQGDVGALPFEDASFDVVFSMNGFHAFPDKAAAFRETARVLKPGGLLLSTFYLRRERLAADIFVKAYLEPRGFFTPPYWTKAELETILRAITAKRTCPRQAGRSC